MWRDIKFSLRVLRHDLRLTVALLAVMATGIAVVTAVFAIVNGVLLKPFAYTDQDRLMVLWQSDAENPRFVVPAANYLDWKKRSRTLPTWPPSSRSGTVDSPSPGAVSPSRSRALA